MFTVLVSLAVWFAWPVDGRLAWIGGFLLPIQAVDGVEVNTLEVVSIVVLALVALRHSSDLSGSSRRHLVLFIGLLVAVLLLRATFGLVRDPALPTARFLAISVATLTVAALVAHRTAAYRPLLMGLLAGSTLSALVTLAQVAGSDLVREAAHGRDRYPGLALQAPGLAWHMAVAVLVAVFAISTAGSARAKGASLGALVVTGIALISCGAQGGLLGMAVTGVLCLGLAWRQINRQVIARGLVLVLVGGVALVGFAYLSGFGASSVSGVTGDPDKGYENERARGRAVKYGMEQIVEAPLAGLGTDEYDARYDVRPHIFPLNIAVNSGILGLIVGSALLLLLGWTAIRGPTDRAAPQGWLGTAVLAVFFTMACLTPSGPFAGVERLTVLLVAVVLARGGAWPDAAVPVDYQVGRMSRRVGQLQQ